MHAVKELLCYYFKNCELCGKPYGKYKKQEYGYICDECLNDINNARIKHRMSFAMPLGLLCSGLFAEQIGVEKWFLISGIGIITISFLVFVLPGVQSLDNRTI